MGIRRYANCNRATGSILVAVVLGVASMVGSVASRGLSHPSMDAGRPISNMPVQGVPPTAWAGSDATSEGRGTGSVYRVTYQTALSRFRAGEMEMASCAFGELASDEKGPLEVRACSLNMMGQIARLGGDRPKARAAFARLASLLEPLVIDATGSADPALARLFSAACVGMGEISEQTMDPNAAIVAYERVLRASDPDSGVSWLYEQTPWIMDRLAHLKLRTRDLDGYLRCAERLRHNHPAYERIALVTLEEGCVRLLRESGDPATVPQNSYDAPAWAIAYARSRDEASVRERLLQIAVSTCSKPPRTYADLVACYHAAWMFDVLGKIEDAVRCFDRVVSADIPPRGRSLIACRMIETIRGYARVQRAILLTETQRYDEALRTLATAATPQGQTHVATLTKATKENIETLKREVSYHENRAQ